MIEKKPPAWLEVRKSEMDGTFGRLQMNEQPDDAYCIIGEHRGCGAGYPKSRDRSPSKNQYSEQRQRGNGPKNGYSRRRLHVAGAAHDCGKTSQKPKTDRTTKYDVGIGKSLLERIAFCSQQAIDFRPESDNRPCRDRAKNQANQDSMGGKCLRFRNITRAQRPGNRR
jgi:hypothetical protein